MQVTPDTILGGYANGWFPMGTESGLVWDNPEQRAIIPIDGLHISRKVRTIIRRGDFIVTADRQFDAVIRACARPDSTWITSEIQCIYNTLHRQGFAHSVEVWRANRLIGGLYGVAIGGAFFGESMFSTAANASKVALAYLVRHLHDNGFSVLDAQYMTPHLASLGAITISREDYLVALDSALARPTTFSSLPFPSGSDSVLQPSSQTS